MGFTLRFCLYQPILKHCYYDDVLIAQQNSKYRKKVPIPVWIVILFIIGFIIPVLNVTVGGLCMAWGWVEERHQFHLCKTSFSKFVKKIVDFLMDLIL